jgi:N-acetylglucosamine kinase-like BadF-type ATPase
MKYFLGVDGGQSSTTALIGDETGRVVGYGRGGPCNHVKTGDGRAKFVNAIGGCVGAAATQAGLDPLTVSFHQAVLGFSGGPADKEAILHEILRVEQMSVSNDGVIALTGATAGAPGIIAIAGTGQLSLGRNAQGRVARAGGWGYVFGDEGGGFDIARQALRAALRQHEGWGPRTALHDVLLAETGAADANELMHRFYTSDWPRPQIAALSKLVDAMARAGDSIAEQILLDAARAQAGFVSAVRAQLFAEGEPVIVAHIGGVWRSDILRERFRTLVELTDGVRVTAPLLGPAAGALLDAYRLAGLTVELTGVPAEK